MRRPGIEPGSTAWKAAMLTIIPPTLAYKKGAEYTSHVAFQQTATRGLCMSLTPS